MTRALAHTRASAHTHAPARRGVARRGLPLLTLLLLAASSSLAHVPIRNSAGNALFWSAADRPVRWVMNDAGSDDIADASEQLAVQRASAAWNAAPGTAIAFEEVTSPGQQARTDWQANDLHLVLFDETNASGFFGPGSSLIAVTNVQFSQGSGKILDADLLFNGGQAFATDLSDGAFDVRSVATHEFGHMLGLDHSPVVGASMAPFTSVARFEPRSLHADDHAGLRATYPAALPDTGRVEGRVRRDGANVVGANVWARADDGRVLAAALTDASGRYALDGLPPGGLRVVTAPLDGPIVPGFLSGLGNPAFDTAFAPAQTGVYALPGSGTLTLDLDAAPDVALRVIEPLTVRTLQRGATTTVHVRVAGFTPATGSGVSIPDAGAALSVTGVQFTPLPQVEGDLLSFPVSVDAEAPVGLYDLRVHTVAGDVALACGYLEVVPPPPQVDAVSPDCSGPLSADELIFFGAHLPVGSEVALGDSFLGFAAPADMGAELLAVPLPPLTPGLRDLVVSVPSGQEARVPGAHLAVTGGTPAITLMYPTTGSVAGGTLVTLTGSGFGPEQVVSLDGVDITPIISGDPSALQFVTPQFDAPGSFAVSVRNPLCDQLLDVAPAMFDVVPAPDLQFFALQPSVLAAGEGGELRVLGANFPVDALNLVLGFDPATLGSFASLPVTVGAPDVLTVQVPPGPVGVLDALLASDGFAHSATLANALYLAPLLDDEDQLVGDIAVAGGVDSLLLDGLADTRVTLTLKRTGKGNSLQPALRVRRDDGSVLASSIAGEPGFDALLATSKPKFAKLAKLTLPGTERYTVELLGVGGSTGSYRLTLTEQLPKTATSLKLPKQGAPAPGAEPVELELSAKAGSRLGGKLNAKDALVLAGIELESPSGALLLATDATGALTGDPDALADVTLDAQGRFVRFKKLVLPDFGVWTLRLFAAPATSGPLGGKLSVKPPKGKTVFSEADG